MRQIASEIAFSKKCTQLKKLHNLRIQQHQPQNNYCKFSNVEFYPRIKNLSDTNFSEPEIKVLKKGLKYSPTLNLKRRTLKT